MRKFTLGLQTAKNTDYIKKCFKQNLGRIKFPKKYSVDAYLVSTPGVKPGGFKDLAIRFYQKFYLKTN